MSKPELQKTSGSFLRQTLRFVAKLAPREAFIPYSHPTVFSICDHSAFLSRCDLELVQHLHNAVWHIDEDQHFPRLSVLESWFLLRFAPFLIFASLLFVK